MTQIVDPQHRRRGSGQGRLPAGRHQRADLLQVEEQAGGLGASELRRVKEPEAENAELKRMYAELALDNTAMKDMIAKKL